MRTYFWNTACLLVALPLFVCVNDAVSAPVIVDFDSGSFTDLTDSQGQNTLLLDSSKDITFSSELYRPAVLGEPGNIDGFIVHRGYGDSNWDNFAFNWYGEDEEYFEFDAPVSLTSIDFRQYVSEGGVNLSYVTNINLWLYGTSSSLLGFVNFSLTTSWNTIGIYQDNVSKVVVDFLGTGMMHPFGYADDRGHSWYNFDNIRYDTDNNLYGDPIPEPATMLLFGIGLVGLIGSRLRKKKK